MTASLLVKDDLTSREGRVHTSAAAEAQLDPFSTEALSSLDRLPLRTSEAKRRERIVFEQHHVGQGTEVIDDARREIFEQRDQLAAHADAGEARVGVARIVRELQAMTREMREHVSATRAQERADQRRW